MATIDELSGGDMTERDRLRHEVGRDRGSLQRPRSEAPLPDPGMIEGGAQDTGGAPVEYGPDMQPRSDAGSFGGMLAGTDADTLVKMVRQDRLARQATKTPTFGEVAEDNRMAQAEAAAAPAAEQEAQAAEIAKSIRFVVDTRTGEFEPVLPGEAEPQIGPTDIFIAIGDDPSQPQILGQGKRVTSADVARLGDPKRAIQPSLRSTYKVPEQYAGLAEALGLKAEG